MSNATTRCAALLKVLHHVPIQLTRPRPGDLHVVDRFRIEFCQRRVIDRYDYNIAMTAVLGTSRSIDRVVEQIFEIAKEASRSPQCDAIRSRSLSPRMRSRARRRPFFSRLATGKSSEGMDASWEAKKTAHRVA